VVAGELFFSDISSALNDRGYSVYTWDTTRLNVEELDYTARAMNPDFIVSVNHIEGLPEACQQLHIPIITWEIDPSTAFIAPKSNKTANSYMYSYNRDNLSAYESASYQSVAHLPLATNPKVRFPVELTGEEDLKYFSDVSFVGASMVDNSKRCEVAFASTYSSCFPAERIGSGAVLLRRLMEMQRQAPSRFITPRLLERLSPEFRGLARDLNLEDPAMLAGEIAASEKRLATLANIGSFSTRIWGDPDWKAVVQFGAEYMGYAGHFYELNKIYSGAKINLDVNRIYQMNIVPMRVFDVLACGGFILTEHSSELCELFEVGVHLETWRDFDELQDKIRWYLAHDKEREAIAKAGREWVLQRHTIEQRVAGMVRELGVCGESAGRVA
jgi:spore maturation protein CgeB